MANLSMQKIKYAFLAMSKIEYKIQACKKCDKLHINPF